MDNLNDNQETANESEVEQTTITSEEFEALKAERDSMKNKMDQLLAETKRAKTERQQAEEAAQAAKLEEAKKAGDFEQLFKSAQERLQQKEQELNELYSKNANEKRDNTAIKIASDLADGPNAEILADYVARRLKYTDEGVKVVDQNGQLTVSSIDELKNEFRNSEKYSSLLRGNQSSGSGASGNPNKGGSAANVVSRAEFDSMDAGKKMAFVKKGGKVTE